VLAVLRRLDEDAPSSWHFLDDLEDANRHGYLWRASVSLVRRGLVERRLAPKRVVYSANTCLAWTTRNAVQLRVRRTPTDDRDASMSAPAES
jgi:hypothetical protein